MSIVPFPRPTYAAKLQVIRTDGLEFKIAGTLDGYLDFCAITSDGAHRTLSLSRDGARALIASIHAVLSDIDRNCMFDRDALLEPLA